MKPHTESNLLGLLQSVLILSRFRTQKSVTKSSTLIWYHPQMILDMSYGSTSCTCILLNWVNRAETKTQTLRLTNALHGINFTEPLARNQWSIGPGETKLGYVDIGTSLKMVGYWSLKLEYWDISLYNRDIWILSLLKYGYWDIGISIYQEGLSVGG